MGIRILVVEDEAELADFLVRGLREEGFTVEHAADGASAEAALRQEWGLVLLDWWLPGQDGLTLLRRHRAEGRDTPILFLTARDAVSDRVRGLDAGADDYVTKPFSPSELVARLRAVLRRSRPERDGETLQYQDLVMDLASHRVRRNGREVHLGPTEFRLLRHLMENQGRVFSREQLLDMVWGRDVYVEPRTVDVHIRRLRKAINADEETDLIRTVRAAGYALDLAE